MATIKLELGKPKSDKSRRAYIIISQGKTRKRISTEINIAPNEITSSGKIKGKKKVILGDMVSRCEDIILNDGIEELGVQLTAQQIYNKIVHTSDDIEFFSFAERWIEKATIKGKKNYITFLNSLEKYIGLRQLFASTIDYNFLSGYSISLEGKSRAQSLYLGSFRHLYKQMVLEYDMDCKNPFDKFKTPKQKMKGQRALDVSELLKVFAYKGTGRAMLARDCAVLSFCLMGTNSVDLYNISNCTDGYVCYDRTKTKGRRADNAHIEIKVPNIISELMKKYAGTTKVFNFCNRYSSAADFNRALNIGLKQIGKEVGIDDLQFYQFRHSWATIAYNDIKIDKGVINDALNHVDRDMRITDIYIKKDYSRINDANEKVIKYLMGEER